VVTVLQALSDTFSTEIHGTHCEHLTIVPGVPTDMLLHLSFPESKKDQYTKVTTFFHLESVENSDRQYFKVHIISDFERQFPSSGIGITLLS